MTEIKYSAKELSDRLGLFSPTEQQRLVIESSLAPALVVAGAGSGKTETMATRVVWLIANQLVKPGEILGLTFTRKAAASLASRIRGHVARLERDGTLDTREEDALDQARVSTYDSFASAIFRDSALRLGREPDGELIGSAAAWQIARGVAIASRNPMLKTLDKSLEAVTQAILNFSDELDVNAVDSAAIEQFSKEFESLRGIPNGGTGEYPEAIQIIDLVSTLPLLSELSRDYAIAKLRRNALQFADQSRLALEAVERFSKVRDELRSRYKVVLLDEYQDTSVLQARLLSKIFAGSAVMAVGDPNQSIYGWRGASADNLEAFGATFSGGADLQTFNLSTSWRNGVRILEAANTVMKPLVEMAKVPIETLKPKEEASEHPIDVKFEETIFEEAESVARWLKEHLVPNQKGALPSAAILFRTRTTQSMFVSALREAGIEYHVLGITGLLDEPEVADLVCALRVVGDANAGSELIRLLAGSKYRIAARDLKALANLAGWLFKRDHAQKELGETVRSSFRNSVAEDENGSIIEALDFISRTKSDHSQFKAFSELGLARLREAGKLFSRLRERSSIDILDFVSLTIQELGLDIEMVANDDREAGSAAIGQFYEALVGFRSTDRNGDLNSFLKWIEHAARTDDLKPRSEPAVPGAVQLLTIHGAKGLEWDLVVVPRMVKEELPKKPRDSSGWVSFGRLPYEFRRDKASLPVFNWRGASSRKELFARFKSFKDDFSQSYALEERRLAYVAITRAKEHLLLTGSFWSSQKHARVPSEFLLELQGADPTLKIPLQPQSSEKPVQLSVAEISWPLDPLGGRRKKVEAAAEMVRAALPILTGEIGEEIKLLIQEANEFRNQNRVLELPYRIPASRFKDFLLEPGKVAENLIRPMPQRPYKATQLGTLFHQWVEHRSGFISKPEELDSIGDFLDDDSQSEISLQSLQANFERSEWASLKPIEVEREIQFPFDGQQIICKLDAVYFRGGRYQIVDWKTGKAPTEESEIRARKIQLALYRIAFSAWRGIPVDQIDAVLFYVAQSKTIALQVEDDEQALLAEWRSAFVDLT